MGNPERARAMRRSFLRTSFSSRAATSSMWLTRRAWKERSRWRPRASSAASSFSALFLAAIRATFMAPMSLSSFFMLAICTLYLLMSERKVPMSRSRVTSSSITLSTLSSRLRPSVVAASSAARVTRSSRSRASSMRANLTPSSLASPTSFLLSLRVQSWRCVASFILARASAASNSACSSCFWRLATFPSSSSVRADCSWVCRSWTRRSSFSQLCLKSRRLARLARSIPTTTSGLWPRKPAASRSSSAAEGAGMPWRSFISR
mmetsp:Transcript_32153/g.61870  ORF Transcript_32153/g.61870 Transcript_32153/m.61870 type:complete len:263 (-) Transcript_32153:860-1648(-)